MAQAKPDDPSDESDLTAEGRRIVAELRAEAEAKAIEGRSAGPVRVVTRRPSNSQMRPHFDLESRTTGIEPLPIPGGVYRRVPVVKSTR